MIKRGIPKKVFIGWWTPFRSNEFIDRLLFIVLILEMPFQIEEALLHRKKLELLQKYVSDDQQAEEGQVKQMLGLWPMSEWQGSFIVL